MALIAVESGVKYSFVSKSIQMRQKGQHKVELTLLPCLYVKPPITSRTAIKTQMGVP